MQRILPAPVIGALAGVGLIAAVVSLASGTGTASKATTQLQAATKATPTTAAAPDATPAVPPATTPPTASPPAAPTTPTCALPGADSSGAAGDLTDITVAMAEGAETESLAAAVTTTPWGASLRVAAVGGSLRISAPPTFTTADFAVADAWFRAAPGVTDVQRTERPAIGALVCLADIADPARLPEVLAAFVPAGSAGGYRYTLSGSSAEVWLARRADAEPDWAQLEAALGALGTVTASQRFDSWL